MAYPRALTVAAIAVLLIGLFYVGYVNELLKGAISPWHRGALLIGFIIGVGAVSRHLSGLAVSIDTRPNGHAKGQMVFTHCRH